MHPPALYGRSPLPTVENMSNPAASALTSFPRRLSVLRPAWFRVIVVAVAVIELTLWTVAESGRTPERVIVYALLAAALFVAAWCPAIGLGIGAAVLPLEVVGLLPRVTTNDWPVYQLLLMVIAVAALPRRRLRIAAAVVAVVSAVSFLLSWVLRFLSPTTAWDLLFGQHTGDWLDFTHRTIEYGEALEVTLSLLPIALGTSLGAWALGVATEYLLRDRIRQDQFSAAKERLRISEADLALASEREQIAQDLHDVLAHSLSIAIVQGQAALEEAGERTPGRQAPSPEANALRHTVDISRRALIDLSRLIEQLDTATPNEPSPGLADLDALIAPMRRLGMQVDFRELGQRAVFSESAQLHVYRILQETLTNALKHDGATARVRITLDWRGDELLLLTASKPNETANVPASNMHIDTSSESMHRGIRNMRARALLAGGWLSASSNDGEFVITAVIPREVNATDGSER